MATGTGKTVVMAMLIAWQTLNKRSSPQDVRFSDAFLITTPGITIRARLRVLLPSDPDNYYRRLDLVPPDLFGELGAARIVITNFHAYRLRERNAVRNQPVKRLNRQILGADETGAFLETPDDMVRRVCRELTGKRNIILINDEAHHCYRPRTDDRNGLSTRSDESERDLAERQETARTWISGLQAVKAKLGAKVVFDLSATPFFLRGSGYREGVLFPWVISDFSLIDAIESGLVKVPRVPVADDAAPRDQPMYRDLWPYVRDELPKKNRRRTQGGPEPDPPNALQGALFSLYGNYLRYFERWGSQADARYRGQTPPVFIIVASNTAVSKLIYDWVAGWEKPLPVGNQS